MKDIDRRFPRLYMHRKTIPWRIWMQELLSNDHRLEKFNYVPIGCYIRADSSMAIPAQGTSGPREIATMKFAMIHHIDRQTIDEMYQNHPAIFILTTGRSGSKFIAQLLAISPRFEPVHEPEPTLQYFSNFAFHHQRQQETLKSMVDAARMERVLNTMNRDKIYIESNQCLVFFAFALAELFRSSRFVHLVRHPGSFACSAIRKGWHQNDSIWEAGRVRSADEEKWLAFDAIQKVGWTWATTHAFIEDFKQSLEESRHLTLRLEDMESDGQVRRLMEFCGASHYDQESARAVRRLRINELEVHPDEPLNMRKNPTFPRYREWPRDWCEKLKTLCSDGASRYGYLL